MKPELMKKAAVAIRNLGAENDDLRSKIECLEKSASSLSEIQKQAEAARIIVQLVADGDVDPEDALEKFAEVTSLSAEEIKLVLRKCEAESIGHVKVASSADMSDPLTAFLLGM